MSDEKIDIKEILAGMNFPMNLAWRLEIEKLCKLYDSQTKEIEELKKPKADFLWPCEGDSVEEAGYEFANGKNATKNTGGVFCCRKFRVPKTTTSAPKSMRIRTVQSPNQTTVLTLNAEYRLPETNILMRLNLSAPKSSEWKQGI